MFYLFIVLAAFGVGVLTGHLRRSSKARDTRVVLYYVDPMHPAYRSSKPGIAPDCGMDLVPVYLTDAKSSLLPTQTSVPDAVKVDAATQQLYGIRLATVESSGSSGTIRVFGRVSADETRTYRVSIGAEGYVKDTKDDATGDFVRKGQRLASVYSPDLIYAASGYLSAVPQGGNGKEASSATPGASVPQARVNQLLNLGFSDTQIEKIVRTRQIPNDVEICSPTDGIILSRTLAPGLRFERRTEFYRIADLSRIWIMAEVFGQDAEAFRPGATARITLADTGKTFEAKVSNVLPQVDATSRTLRPRLEMNNPGFKLRPDMLVSIEIPVSRPSALTIPADALIDSGSTKRVYTETSEGSFEPREVEVGWRQGDKIQIVKGLKAGDKVVSDGSFLIDSESRLKLASNAGGSSAGFATDKTTSTRSSQ